MTDRPHNPSTNLAIRDVVGRLHAVHVHRRDWRPCPVTMRPPLRPTKPAAVWWFAFADAVQYEATFRAFIAAHPADFPRVRGAS